MAKEKAIQWKGHNDEEIETIVNVIDYTGTSAVIEIDDDIVYVNIDEWILKNRDGEISVMSDVDYASFRSE